ncbi:hypothetical protein [Peptostreptococcus porci]|uniref:hypothetical protein n=1 Tax=Peptostreptococcus porci TaxID=2652282 RepID=UPI002A912BA2|nr:hypothetical protein [Peptostreptococcus porci]MDY6232177.1 hypothetical protein [Peptostreptococcus porci]
MNEIAIKRHSFDLAKNRLKEFSEKTEAELEIDKVRTDGGFFGLGDHKVTGYELNRRLETIQEHFIAVNTTSTKVIKEFREVYNALDVLDKDYITSIVANVKAIEKNSNDVRVQQGTLKQHNEKLANQQSKLDAHQAEIEKNVANISKIVAALKVFKENLEGYKHLTDIDKIWNDCKSIQNEIRVVSDSVTKFSKKITEDIDNMWDDLDICKKNIEIINADIQTQQNELNNLATTSKNHTDSIDALSKKMAAAEEYAVDSRNLITKLETFREEVCALNYLMEVDEIWKQTGEHQTRINRVEQECRTNTDKLSGISHLDDVDGMWNNVEEHTSKLIKCEKRDEELADAIQKNKEEVNENIAEAVRTANVAIETLTKKVKYAYWIAGGTAGLAIIELILLLV